MIIPTEQDSLTTGNDSEKETTAENGLDPAVGQQIHDPIMTQSEATNTTASLPPNL